MNKVFFKPWVGVNYARAGYDGKKLLILGESHYCEIDAICNTCGLVGMPGCNDFTDATVKKFLAYKASGEGHERWMNTYTKFGNVLANRALESQETIDLWQSLVFYNFVQVAISDKRTPPSGAAFQQAKDAFFQVLIELKPDLVIAWGDRLWNKLPDTGKSIQFAGTEFFIYELESGLIVPTFSVYHPSTGYFGYGAHEGMRDAIKNCHNAIVASSGLTVQQSKIRQGS